VVVATIQRKTNLRKAFSKKKGLSTLKTEVAKVFTTTEFARELVDPNPKDYEK